MNSHEDCPKCGTPIPRGYGYYLGIGKVVCVMCGNINQKKEPPKKERKERGTNESGKR